MTLLPYPPGESTDYPLSGFLEPVRNTVCSVAGGVQRLLSEGLNVGTDPLIGELERLICPPERFPVPVAPNPVPGGQCPVGYLVDYTITFDNGRGQGYNLERTSDVLAGAITGVVTTREVQPSNPTFFNQIDSIGFAGGASLFKMQETTVGGGSTASAIIRQIRRVDGQLDNCGDGLPTLPPPPPGAPPIPPNITVNIGGTNVLLPFFFTPVIISPTLNFEPHLAIRVGPIDIDLSLDGYDITSRPRPSRPPILPPSYPPGTPTAPPVYPSPPQTRPRNLPPGGGGGDCPNVDISPVITRIDTAEANLTLLLDCDRCVLDDPTLIGYQETLVFTGGSGRITLSSRCTLVKLNLVSQTNNLKSQAGVNADDVFYIGWQSFSQSQSNYIRQPIHYLQNIYRRPRQCTQFTFTCYNGIIAQVIEITKTE